MDKDAQTGPSRPGRLLAEFNRSLWRAEDEKEILYLLTRELTKTPYVCGIYFTEGAQLNLHSLIDPRDPEKTIRRTPGVRIALQKVSAYLAENNPLILQRISQFRDLEKILAIFFSGGCSSLAIFPHFENNLISKLFIFASRETRPLTQAALEPVAELVEIVSSNLERVQYAEKLHRQTAILQFLANTSRLVSSETELEHFYHAFHELAGQLFGSEIGVAIVLYNPESELIEAPYVFQGAEAVALEAYPLGEGLVSQVIKTGQPLLLSRDVAQKAQEMNAKILGKPPQSWLGVPLFSSGEVIGALVLQDINNEDRFSPGDIDLFSVLASQIASIIQHSRLVTKTGQLETAWQRERILFDTLVDNLRDQVYLKDGEGRYLYASKSYAAGQKIGAPQEMLDKTDLELAGDEEGAASHNDDLNIFSSGQRQTKRLEKTGSDGENAIFLQHRIPLQDAAGKPIGLLGILREISENIRAEELAQRRSQQLQALADLSVELLQTPPDGQDHAAFLQRLNERFGYSHSALYLLEPVEKQAVLHAAAGQAAEEMTAAQTTAEPGEQTPVGQALQTRQMVLLQEIGKEQSLARNPLLSETGAEIVLPLLAGQDFFGALDIHAAASYSFTPDEIAILQATANLLALGFQNTRAASKIHRLLKSSRTLYEITQAITASGSVEAALVTTVQSIRREIECDHVYLFWLNKEGRLAAQNSSEPGEEELSQVSVEVGEGYIGLAALLRQPALVQDARSDSRALRIAEGAISQLAVPILYGGRLLGVLAIESSKPAAYDEEDTQIFGALANNLGAILHNTQLVREVRKQVEKQRQIYEITSKIRRSVDVQTILETSASEIAKALGVDQVQIEIKGADLAANGAPHSHQQPNEPQAEA